MIRIFQCGIQFETVLVMDNQRGVNISALMCALPVSALEPGCIASIAGFVKSTKDRDSQNCIWLLEPPAGQRTPYIEPVKALDILLRSQDYDSINIQARLFEAIGRLRNDIAENCWVSFFDYFDPETLECIPVSEFVMWLRKEMPFLSDILDFLQQAAKVAISTPIFRGPDNWNSPWSLESLPTLPPAKSMIEFVPGSPWCYSDEWDDRNSIDNPFFRWREAIYPIAIELEKALGEPVYYFADLNNDTDDDAVHRFLVLHWCCTYKPESTFVRYLIRVSGVGDVEELKSALIDPASYTQPFKMNYAFFGMEATSCRIDYIQPDVSKTVAVMFLTQEARNVAQSLLAQKISMHAFIIAPRELVTVEWVKQATRYCRTWSIRYVYDSKLTDPIEFLALVDEICVIANEQTPKTGYDLKLSDSAEDFLWLALNLGINANYFHIDGLQLNNPQDCLKKRGVSERVAVSKALREDFTRQLKEKDGSFPKRSSQA